MKLSDAGARFIAAHEIILNSDGSIPAKYLRPYNDPVGFSTIAIGHLVAKRPVNDADRQQWGTLTEAQALDLFRSDARRFIDKVAALVTVPLTQSQFDALVSLAFNIGEGNFARSTLLKKLNQGDYKGAASEFAVWNKAKGRVLPGLVSRRRAETEMFLRESLAAMVPVSAAQHIQRLPGESLEVAHLRAYVKGSGVPHRVTSTVRSKLPSKHAQQGTEGQGLAGDFAGPQPGRNTPELLAVFQAFKPVEHQLYELIYSGSPYSIKNGKRVPQYAIDDHWDHVHTSVNKGVFIERPGGGQEDEMQRVVRTTKGDGSEWPGRYLTDDLSVSYIGTGSRLEDLEARFGPAQPIPRQDFDQLVKINGSVGWPE